VNALPSLYVLDFNVIADEERTRLLSSTPKSGNEFLHENLVAISHLPDRGGFNGGRVLKVDEGGDRDSEAEICEEFTYFINIEKY
jgi:hypothetical protein